MTGNELTMLNIYSLVPGPRMKGPAEALSIIGPGDGRPYNVVNIRPFDLGVYVFPEPSKN